MAIGCPRPWRSGSEYVDPPRNTLDRGQRHVWRRRVVAEARAGNLPGKAILVAEALLACMSEEGALYPSHAAIAGKAGVGLRTVSRHLARMAELGLLQRIRRLVRKPWPEGGRGAVRVEQTSNAFLLLFPVRAVGNASLLRSEEYRNLLHGQVIAAAASTSTVEMVVQGATVAISPTVGRATITNSIMVGSPPNTGSHVGPVETRRLIPPVPAVDRVAALAALEAVRVAREAAASARWWAGRR